MNHEAHKCKQASFPANLENPFRQNLFRAGHAHAVVLVLSLIALRYRIAGSGTCVRRSFGDDSSSGGFFLHAIAARHAPNGFIYLAYVGAMVLASGLLTLGVGR